MSANLVELAARRRTTRIFARTPVNMEDVLYCVGVAAEAPSGANRQPWHFILVDDPERKAKIRETCEAQEKRYHETVEPSLRQWFKSKGIAWLKPFLIEAPILMAVLSDQKMPYATESTWLAIGYTILALEERSLSTLTYTPSYPENVRGVFGAPEQYRIEAILPIGYSADPKPKEQRRAFQSSIHKNVWNAKA